MGFWTFYMRVFAGKFRSRQLRSLPGLDIRPTSDRLRETLFDVLTAVSPEALQRSVWLDLFAGTGAVGIEALSRGAEEVYFVESSRKAAELISRNLASLGIAAGFEILRQRAAQAILQLQARRIVPDFIFLDPPYEMETAYEETLHALACSQLSKRALIIAEHQKKFDPGEKVGKLARTRKLVQGDAGLSFYSLL